MTIIIQKVKTNYTYEGGRDDPVVRALASRNGAQVRFRPRATCGFSLLLTFALLAGFLSGDSGIPQQKLTLETRSYNRNGALNNKVPVKNKQVPF